MFSSCAACWRASSRCRRRGSGNQLDLRPLEGFVFAVTPFNFTSIAGNLPTAPALFGNTVVEASAELDAQRLLHHGTPAGSRSATGRDQPGVGSGGRDQCGCAFASRSCGVHFTGSTGVFHQMWRTVGQNIDRYRAYPRLVGETGGKDFILAHDSADEDALVAAIVRGGYEYQGQKCSAASRIYLPSSMADRVLPRLVAEINSLQMGDVSDFRNFVGAVIDRRAFQSIRSYIEVADGQAGGARILCGGSATTRRATSSVRR